MGKIDISLLGVLFTDVCSAPLERLPNSGECLFTDEMKITPGGCPVNSGIALAKMGIRCGVVGKVGRDPLGGLCVQELGCTDGIKPWGETVRFMEENSIQIEKG